MHSSTQEALKLEIAPPAFRSNDLRTAKAAGALFGGKRFSELHIEVLEAFETFGKLTDEDLEELPKFAGYAYSSVRKRRTDLFQRGYLRAAGEKTNSRGRAMTVWEIDPTFDPARAREADPDLEHPHADLIANLRAEAAGLLARAEALERGKP